MWGKDFAIDLGTSKIAIYAKGDGVILTEPSVIAVDQNGTVLSAGSDAQRMLGKTPGGITAVQPLSDGVISDFTLTEKMLSFFLKKAVRRSFIKPRMLICVPTHASSIEKKAVLDAGFSSGAREVLLIDEPIAAAIGAGLAIDRPKGHMVVDIGGGTCDIAVISLGQMVTGTSVKAGGRIFDAAISLFLRRHYNLVIGDATAEQVKFTLGSVFPLETEIQMTVKGRSSVTGYPETAVISSVEIRRALEESVLLIIDAIKSVFEKTPPEMIGDILNNGVLLTGGGSMLRGMAQRLEHETGAKIIIPENPRECVILGSGQALKRLDLVKDLEINRKSKRRTDFEEESSDEVRRCL